MKKVDAKCVVMQLILKRREIHNVQRPVKMAQWKENNED
jgi:hypothetical protein